jgi:hypothetical protein
MKGIALQGISKVTAAASAQVSKFAFPRPFHELNCLILYFEHTVNIIVTLQEIILQDSIVGRTFPSVKHSVLFRNITAP